MPLSPEQVAEAFSRHDFDAAIPYLAEDVRWDVVGNTTIVGKSAVLDSCREAATHLADVSTTFRRFMTVATPECVVTDSLADYVEGSGHPSAVASCDLYLFTDGLVSEIRSYTVEVT